MRRVTADFINERPPRRSRILKWIAQFYFWITGWKLVGTLPATPKLILMAAPHTSNWDGLNLILASWVARADLNWMVKDEWTHGLAGLFIRWAGGLGIKRDKAYNVVDMVVKQLEEYDEFLLLIAPSGTRKYTDHWKTGFYWIAHRSGVPLMGSAMDYGRKQMIFTGPYEVTGDIEKDIIPIWAHYATITARHPEKVSDRRFKQKDLKRAARYLDKDRKPEKDSPIGEPVVHAESKLREAVNQAVKSAPRRKADDESPPTSEATPTGN